MFRFVKGVHGMVRRASYVPAKSNHALRRAKWLVVSVVFVVGGAPHSGTIAAVGNTTGTRITSRSHGCTQQ